MPLHPQAKAVVDVMAQMGRSLTGDAAVVRAADLRGLPPALVITAEYDPLRDEGEAYVARLSQAGVRTEHVRYDGQIHAFFGNAMIEDGMKAIDRVGAARAADECA